MRHASSLILLDPFNTTEGIAENRHRIELVNGCSGKKLSYLSERLISFHARFDPDAGRAAQFALHAGFGFFQGLFRAVGEMRPKDVGDIFGRLAMPCRAVRLAVAPQLIRHFFWRWTGSKRCGAKGIASPRRLFG